MVLQRKEESMGKSKVWRVPDKTLAKVIEALSFYRNSQTYHAWAFISDEPAGDWGSDFEHDEEYGRSMPGARANRAYRALHRALKPQLPKPKRARQ